MRQPSVPAQLATAGFTYLQFAALPTTARDSANPYGFALVAMLGLLGLRVCGATGADIGGFGGEHGHRILRFGGNSAKVALVFCRQPWGGTIDRIWQAAANFYGEALARPQDQRLYQSDTPLDSIIPFI